MNLFKKQPAKPANEYRPAEAVRLAGDHWSTDPAVRGVSAATSIALRDTPRDASEASIMGLLERGVIPRVREYV
jgi:hypothetical protein